MSPSRLPVLVFRLHALGVALLFAAVSSAARAGEVKVIPDLSYRSGPVLTKTERATGVLDLYLPADGQVRATLLWLHGGGLTGGTRNSAATVRAAQRLAGAGIAVASAEYRKNPDVHFPAYIQDAADALAWLHGHIAGYGGDPSRVFIGGHSAGAYLSLMVALDDRFLSAAGMSPNDLAGVVAISGQTSTHFTVRAEDHDEGPGLIVDRAAPLFHVRPRDFPFLLLYAGKDMPLRVEENRLLAAALRRAGCADVREHFYADRNHGTIFTQIGTPGDPVGTRVIDFLLSAERKPAKRP